MKTSIDLTHAHRSEEQQAHCRSGGGKGKGGACRATRVLFKKNPRTASIKRLYKVDSARVKRPCFANLQAFLDEEHGKKTEQVVQLVQYGTLA
jgi:hypothetical protein